MEKSGLSLQTRHFSPNLQTAQIILSCPRGQSEQGASCKNWARFGLKFIISASNRTLTSLQSLRSFGNPLGQEKILIARTHTILSPTWRHITSQAWQWVYVSTSLINIYLVVSVMGIPFRESPYKALSLASRAFQISWREETSTQSYQGQCMMIYVRCWKNGLGNKNCVKCERRDSGGQEGWGGCRTRRS